MCITLITASLNLGAGHPTGAGHAEATENDDGADPLPVHVHIPSSHSVPEKLKAHISSHNFLRGPDHVKRLQRKKKVLAELMLSPPLGARGMLHQDVSDGMNGGTWKEVCRAQG